MALERIGRCGKNRLGMDVEGTAQHWLIKASTALYPVSAAVHRFSASLRVTEVTMLAAADELQAATWDAKRWMAANACPDVELRGRVVLLLKTCAEAALTAQRAIFDPAADTQAIIGRLCVLVSIIDLQSQALDDW
jgi:hypothetical protein